MSFERSCWAASGKPDVFVALGLVVKIGGVKYQDMVNLYVRPRKTMTFDQGKEMSEHKHLLERTGVAVFFANLHSLWPRGSNENTNVILRQYLPKGTDLSGFMQEGLDAIAWQMNNRPRKIHGFRTPLQGYNELLQMAQMPTEGFH